MEEKNTQEKNKQKNIITKEGFQNLEKELEYLKATKRKEISERIKKALAFGDLSENSEYDEAKNEQSLVEMRILEIEKILKTSKILDEKDIDTNSVFVGCKVIIQDLDKNIKLEYKIVGSSEADPVNSKISSDSPIGLALLGNKVGTDIKAQTPNGIRNFKILEIGR